MSIIERTNKVKAKMDQGQKVIGSFFTMGSVPVLEILSMAGLDFLMIDTEHGPYDVETAQQLIIACESRGITPFVRVKDYNRNSVLKMLDVGAMGLLIPFIKNVDQVKELVGYAKYKPVGERGFGGGREVTYNMDPVMVDVRDYFAWANRETLLIPQCETVEALESIEEITAIDGVDGIFVGPFDLSIAMGIPQQFDHPDFTAALERVITACKKNDKFCWVLGVSPEDVCKRFEMGFDGVLTVDSHFLIFGTIQYFKTLEELDKSLLY